MFYVQVINNVMQYFLNLHEYYDITYKKTRDYAIYITLDLSLYQPFCGTLSIS